MNVELTGLGRIDPTAAPQRSTRVPSSGSARPVATPAAAFADVVGASPPPELAAEVEAAWDAVDQLHAQQRELHFRLDDESGKVHVEVRDLEGNVVRTVPNTEALEIAGGKPV